MDLLLDKYKYNDEIIPEGKITKAVGLTIEATGFVAPIGTICQIKTNNNNYKALIVGFSGETIQLLTFESIKNLEIGNIIQPTYKKMSIPIGNELLGRVVDPSGRVLDNGADLNLEFESEIYSELINPLERELINEKFETGVKSIDGFLTLGLGQRMGIFAGSGVGKSSLIGMLIKNSQADVVVVGLIGERGREVSDFVAKHMKGKTQEKTIVVAAPADYSPVLRLHGAYATMAIAEFFCKQGKNVLLVLDSLTRFAQAQREIGLSIGESPVSKGYPPSVFTLIPQLIERAGNFNNSGSITSIFSVLSEQDDVNDPIVDSARAILDGHIFLTRGLAEKNHYPAIDIRKSISRLQYELLSKEDYAATCYLRKLYALYHEKEDIINMGLYQEGVNNELDLAISKISKINNLLEQKVDEKCNLKSTFQIINTLCKE